MTSLFPRGITVVWALLIVLSLCNSWLGLSRFGGGWTSLGVALLAGAKVFLVLHFFMGLGKAPRAWRWLLGLWLAVMTGVMFAGQLQ